MASPSLSVRIADLARRAMPSGQIGRDHHQSLFLLYLEIDETLAYSLFRDLALASMHKYVLTPGDLRS